MQPDQNDQIQKIKKLLALAEDAGATESERDLARDKAVAMMTKYGIEAAHLATVDPARAAADPIVTLKHMPAGQKIFDRQWRWLAHSAADPFGVIVIGFPGWKKNDRVELGFIGHQSDVDRVIVLWRSLEMQVSLALATFVANEKYWYTLSPMKKFIQRRAFISAFAERVGARLMNLHRSVVEEQHGPGTALVLKNRKMKVAEWVDNNLTLSFGKSRSLKGSLNGAAAGAAAGNKANIGQVTVGTTGPRSIGS